MPRASASQAGNSCKPRPRDLTGSFGALSSSRRMRILARCAQRFFRRRGHCQRKRRGNHQHELAMLDVSSSLPSI